MNQGQIEGEARAPHERPAVQMEGSDEKTAGKVQKKIGQIERVFEN